MSNNQYHAVGNLVADPELRFTASTGKPVLSARVAVNERIQRNGEWTDRVSYVNLVAWNSLAENVARLEKGNRVMFSGRLQTRDYEDANGERRFFTEIVCTEIGVALRWHTVEGIEKANGQTEALVGAPAGNGEGGDPTYGDSDVF